MAFCLCRDSEDPNGRELPAQFFACSGRNPNTNVCTHLPAGNTELPPRALNGRMRAKDEDFKVLMSLWVRLLPGPGSKNTEKALA